MAGKTDRDSNDCLRPCFRPTILGDLFHTRHSFMPHFNIFFFTGFSTSFLITQTVEHPTKTQPKGFGLTSRQAQWGL
jgi:hypothetical protein